MTGSLADVNNLEYDVVLTASDGVRLGLMLARPYTRFADTRASTNEATPGPKDWEVDEISVPTALRVSEAGVSLTDLPPEMAATIYKEDHSGGLGAAIVGTNNRYYSGTVAAVAGKVFKPPLPEEITLPTSETSGRVWVEFNSRLYVSDGRYLHRSADGLNFTQVLDTGAANIITDAIVFGDTAGVKRLYVFGKNATTGDGFNYYYSETGASGDWVQRTTAAGSASQHAFVRDDTLFLLTNPNLMYTTQTPIATIGGAVEVGDKSSNFQGGGSVFTYMLVRKTDAVYWVDASNNVGTLIGSTLGKIDANNFLAGVSGMGGIWYTPLDNDVWAYDPWQGAVDPLHMRDLPDTQQAVSSYSPGLAFDGVALYTIHATALPPAGTSILRVIRHGSGTDTTYTTERWFIATDANDYRAQGPLHATKLFGRSQLYFNTTTAGRIGRLNLFASADATLDPASQYSTRAVRLRTGWMSHNFPAETKDYTEITVAAHSVTPVPPSTTIDVYYYRDGDELNATSVGTVDSNGATTFRLSAVSGESFMLEFLLNNDGPSSSPQLLSWSVKAAVKFPQREKFTITARIGDNIRNRHGNTSTETALSLRRGLKHMRAAKNISIQYQDFAGYDISNIRILPRFKERVVLDSDSGQIETWLTMQLLRVSSDIDNEFVVASDVVAGPAVIGA